MTALVVGSLLAVGVAIFGRLVGLERDRAFYSTILIIVGSYYVLFAVMAGSTSAVIPEAVAFAVFAGLAAVGFRASFWLVAVGLVAHGLFDFLRGDLINNPGVPNWWPMFCGAYDVVAGTYVGWLAFRRGRSGLQTQSSS